MFPVIELVTWISFNRPSSLTKYSSLCDTMFNINEIFNSKRTTLTWLKQDLSVGTSIYEQLQKELPYLKKNWFSPTVFKRLNSLTRAIQVRWRRFLSSGVEPKVRSRRVHQNLAHPFSWGLESMNCEYHIQRRSLLVRCLTAHPCVGECSTPMLTFYLARSAERPWCVSI